MRAWAVVENKAPLQCIEVDDPVPVGTEVVVDVSHCGVCHSDLHFWEGSYDMGGGQIMRLRDRGVTLPRAIGHEISGRIIAHGPDAEGIEIGEQCAVYPWIGCGDCDRCAAGDDNLCMRQQSLGVLRHGGFAERVVVPHARYLVPLNGIDPAWAATFGCSGITVLSAIKKLQPQAPDSPVLLIGAGGLGLSAIAMLKALGHDRIISADIDARKREAALDMGATQAIDSAAADAAQQVEAAAGGKLSGAIDFVNVTATAQLATAVLGKGGKLIMVGVGGGQIPLSLAGMVFLARTVQGSNTGTPQDLRDVVSLAAAGKLSRIPLHRMPKDEANRAMTLLNENQVSGRIVLTKGAGASEHALARKSADP
ncbi:alcohol dehydrogenase [Bosea sp. (in: a-proteobacteria)]|uniref:alcohol dehydrogenase n=1 Tax=Bosea sp. (in: a-proteobacteria) TaxID=1871050 RepID=UPI003B3B0F54